jgi:hypothetical protein
MEGVLPLDVLASTPSIKDGVHENEEMLHRVFGCELTQEACILLRLRQVVAATAQSILHRFYYRHVLDIAVFLNP